MYSSSSSSSDTSSCLSNQTKIRECLHQRRVREIKMVTCGREIAEKQAKQDSKITLMKLHV